MTWMALLHFKCMMKSFAIKCAPINSNLQHSPQATHVYLTVDCVEEYGISQKTSRGGKLNRNLESSL